MISQEALIKRYCSSESYVSARIIAAHFSMSIPTIYRLALLEKIPSYKIGGKRRFKISELEAAFKV
jgi:excisionase family DNA binding protein